MRRTAYLVALAPMFLAGEAHAIDCGKAATAVETTICGDKTLVALDRSLGKAYQALLKAMPDKDTKAMIVASQQRWLTAREDAFGKGETGADKDVDPTPLPKVLKLVMQDRIKVLKDRSKNGLIARAKAQKAFFARYPDAAYTGLRTECTFMMPRQGQAYTSYICPGSAVELQRDGRVCTISQTWATFSIYTQRSVATVDGDTLKPVAFCANPGNDGSECTADMGPQTRWNRDPAKAQNFDAPQKAMNRLDAENEVWRALEDGDKVWLKRCVTDKTYP